MGKIGSVEVLGRPGVLGQTISFWFLCLALVLTSGTSVAQSLRTKKTDSRPISRFSSNVRYSVLSDLASQVSPKTYRHSVSGELGYDLTSKWTLGSEISVAADTIDGQISKGSEESYSETVDPSVSIDLSFSDQIYQKHRYSLFAGAEPFLTEDSRLEGYRGILAAGGSLSLNFFNKRYSLAQSLVGSTLLNSYRYNLRGDVNPGDYYVYTLTNSVRFFKTMKLSHSFGIKTTHYLDGFWGYSYVNNAMISNSWQKFTVALLYANGGYTEDGSVRMWYIDQYRRVFQLLMSYTF